jgi:tetratricopeptide (TPR) repeat protein
MASTAEPALRESDSRQWLDRLEVELGNIRAALNWSLAEVENSVGMQLASALRRFWLARGYLVEGLDWIEQALTRGSGTPPELQAKAIFAAGELAFFLHDVGRATELAERGLALCRAIEDTSGVPDALLGLGQLARQSGDLERATTYLSEGISLAEVSGDIRALTLLQDAMGGVLADLGDLDGALALFKRSQEYNRTVGNERGEAASLAALADIAWRRGNLDQAIDLREEALAILRLLRDGYAIALVSLNLAKMVQHQHDFTRAKHLLLEGLAVAWDHRLTSLAAAHIHNLASLAGELGDSNRAARLLGATTAFCREMSIPEPDEPITNTEERARSALGDVLFAKEKDTGERLTAHEAIAEALQTSL